MRGPGLDFKVAVPESSRNANELCTSSRNNEKKYVKKGFGIKKITMTYVEQMLLNGLSLLH